MTLKFQLKTTNLFPLYFHVPFSMYMNVCMVNTYNKDKDQPVRVDSTARGQLNRENDFFRVPVRA